MGIFNSHETPISNSISIFIFGYNMLSQLKKLYWHKNSILAIIFQKSIGFQLLILSKTYFLVKILIASLQLPEINKRTVRNKIIQVGKSAKN